MDVRPTQAIRADLPWCGALTHRREVLILRLRNVQQGSVLRYSRLYAQEIPKFLIGNIEPCGLPAFCDSPSPSNAESWTWKVTPGGPESLSVAFKMWFRPEETANRSLEDVLGPNSTTKTSLKSSACRSTCLPVRGRLNRTSKACVSFTSRIRVGAEYLVREALLEFLGVGL
jgi:hypothetical protein